MVKCWSVYMYCGAHKLCTLHKVLVAYKKMLDWQTVVLMFTIPVFIILCRFSAKDFLSVLHASHAIVTIFPHFKVCDGIITGSFMYFHWFLLPSSKVTFNQPFSIILYYKKWYTIGSFSWLYRYHAIIWLSLYWACIVSTVSMVDFHSI